jgi:outer membrane protein assembly factor BamB
MTTRTLIPCLCLLPLALAADWPQWQGPDRTNVSKETGLLKDWPKGGPPLRWTFAKTGIGFSGPAVVGDRLYIMGARKDAGGKETEYLLALNISNGREVWAARIGPLFTFQTNIWGDGPRATPTVDGDLVFAQGAQGDLVCVETAKGQERWRRNLLTQLDGEISPAGGGPEKIGWGYTSSPLVDGDLLVCVVGGKKGTLAALNKKTGKPAWRSKDVKDPACYASPIVAEAGGIRQYIQQTDRGLAGVAAKDGKKLWYYKMLSSPTKIIIPTPVFHKDQVYTSIGDGFGCLLLKLTAEGMNIKVSKVFANKIMKNNLGGVVQVGDYLYGYSERRGWVCQKFKDGKLVWADEKLGPGSLTFADGRLYCFGEDDGQAVLVEATPTGWKEHGRFEIPRKSNLPKTRKTSSSSKIWTHPVVANGRLYLRDQEYLFCFDVQDKK